MMRFIDWTTFNALLKPAQYANLCNTIRSHRHSTIRLRSREIVRFFVSFFIVSGNFDVRYFVLKNTPFSCHFVDSVSLCQETIVSGKVRFYKIDPKLFIVSGY
jgi:hypothetical protein